MKRLIFLVLAALIFSFEVEPVGPEPLVPEQVQIKVKEVQVINKPIVNGILHFIFIHDGREDAIVLNIGAVDVGGNITASSPPTEVRASEFQWMIVLADGSEELMVLRGWSDFRSAKYENPVFFDEKRLSIPRNGSSVIISVTRVTGVVQFAAELQKTTYGNFTLRYWIDVDGDSQKQPAELTTKNLSSNGTLLLDSSSFTSLRLVTAFDVQLNFTDRNVVQLLGTWDFRTNKPLFSNSSLSPDLDVVKWAWFYPDPKSTTFEIQLDNDELFHGLKTGSPTDSISHGSGVLVGRPTELLNDAIRRLRGEEVSEGSQAHTTTPIQQILSQLSLGSLTPLGVLILIPTIATLSVISAIKVRRYIRKKRLIKTGET
ncbi:hypothetical protein KEJ25_07885 [Candidatus Bathyarchaeota archaeon]|nr:hypothetical protein [Candidatus Bathyarchaeota archaeon]